MAVIFAMVELISHVPFFVLLGYPADGTDSRHKIRLIIWAVAIICEMFTIPISMYVSKILKNKYFIGLNIEHAAERYGLFIIIIVSFVLTISWAKL